MSRGLLAGIVLGTSLLGVPVHAGLEDVVISEIVAINDSILRDEDGDFSDVLELHNPGPSAVDMGGCYLTDDALEPAKWRFPSVAIPGGGFLLVFCSDKDRRDPAGELHANFKLRGSGEYLALVAPDGFTVLFQYAPFPEQVADYSYGLAMHASFLEAVDATTLARTKIPTVEDAAAATSLAWTEVDFPDDTWISGPASVGYDNGSEYDPLIGTDVEAQMDGVNTSAWIRIPFHVDDPSELGVLTLRVKYDDGFIAYLNGVHVAEDEDRAPAWPAPWDASATQDHTDSAAKVFVEWSFPNDGLLRAGRNVLAIHGLNRNLTSSDFLIVPELEATSRGELDPEAVEFFAVPTPGSGNVPGFPGIARKPVVGVPSLMFQTGLDVQLLKEDPAGVIRYTLDGGEPTESSTVYDAVIRVTSTTVLRARTFVPGLAPSPIVTARYIRGDSAISTRTSTLPIVVVDTLGSSIPSTSSTSFGPAVLALFDRKENGRSALSNVPDIVSKIGIRERGSSSAGRPKKSYRFEFWDEQDEDKDVEPLELPVESDWILYGAYNFDHTHLRNPLIYELSRQAGPYAARTRFVELYLNTTGGPLSTSSHYWGIYSLMETLKRGNDRIDVERLGPSVTTSPEITGGYVLKKDRSDPGGSGSFSAGGVSGIQFVYPDIDYTNSAQRSWIQSHLDTVFTTTDFMAWIDPVAAIDHHLLNALAKNVDAFRLSGYFHKPRGGPVVFGPIWDFDRSMGSTDGRDDEWDTWRGTGDSSGYFAYDSRTPYWSRWLQDRDFLQLWKDRWHELRQGPLKTLNVMAVINLMANEIREAQPRDQNRWGRTSDWEGDLYQLRNWLNNRLSWIDGNWLRPPRFSRAGGLIAPGFSLSITASGGSVYYTTDGSDPRSPGGYIAAGARLYSAPLVLEDNARVVARLRASDSDWSAPTAETYFVSTPPVVITELMFHPADPESPSPFLADDFEFVELMHTGDGPVDLSGFELTGGIRFTFPGVGVGGAPLVLSPRERVVVVSNLEAFSDRYGTAGILIAGVYEGNLGNAGDTVGLHGPLREPIHLFEYGDQWHPTADGGGYSLSVVDPLGPLWTWGEPDAWAPSSVLGGTPGDDDSGLPELGGYQIPGDANQDGVLDVSDSLALLLLLYSSGTRPLPCGDGAPGAGGNLLILDVNGDGEVDLSDAVFTLQFLFLEGDPPALGTACVRISGCPHLCR